MQFFTSAIITLQTLVVALGAGLGVWGVVNLLEGYGSDNPGSKNQGMNQVTRGEGELAATELKTKNSIRKVALSQQAVDLLAQEHERHPDSPLLFPSPHTGGYWSPDAVSRINCNFLKNAGIEEHVRFRNLRHTFATMAISSGVDVKMLSSMLGHYSAGFTLGTYTHITNDMQRGAAEKIGDFMETTTAKPNPEPPNPP